MHAHNTDTHATQRTLCKGKVTVPHCSSLKTHDFALRSFHVVFTWDKHCHSCTPLVYYIHLTNTGYLIKWPVSVRCFESFHGLQPVCPFSSVCRALVIIFFSLRDRPLSSGAGCASVKIAVNQFVIHSCFSSFLMLALNRLHHVCMSKYIELLPFDWLISYLLNLWPVNVRVIF